MSETKELTRSMPGIAELKPLLLPYQKSDVRRAVIQVLNSVLPYVFLWYLMYLSLRVSYFLTLALAIIASGFLVRIFIIFHDCGHNSFLPSTTANKRLGFWMGVLVFTPGEQWWRSHAIHHATSGNLDKRGVGDVLTLTVEEYQEFPWWKRLGYRLVRNPIVLFILAPAFMFLIAQRFALPALGKKETASVVWCNLAVLGMVSGLIWLMGWQAYLMIQIPVMAFAGSAGIFLFYVQHQYEGAYWERDKNWTYTASALLGASYFRLPRGLQWFSGNIGFHHLHHLSPRIPNYFLEACSDSNRTFQEFGTLITFRNCFKTAHLKLWDEKHKKLVGFNQVAVEATGINIPSS